MNPFSICIVLVYIYLIAKFIKKDLSFNKLFLISISISIAIILYCNVGFFANLGYVNFTYFEITQYFVFLISLAFIIVKKPSKKFVKFMIGWILFIVLNNLLLILFPTKVESVSIPGLWYDFFVYGTRKAPKFTKHVISYDLYFIFLPIVLNVFKQMLIKSKDEIVKFFNAISLFWIPISLSEVFIKLVFGESFFFRFRDLIFGLNSDTVSQLTERGGIPFFGLCSEPSVYAFTLFLVTLFYLTINYKKRTTILYIIITSFFGLLTQSFTFVLFIILQWSYYFVLNRVVIIKFIRKYKYIFFGILGIFILGCTWYIQTSQFSYYWSRIENIMKIFRGEDIGYVSEVSRIFSSSQMIKVFIDKPLFGAGIGTTYGFSALANLLSNMGLVGVTGIYFMFKSFLRTDKKSVEFYFLLIILLITFIVQGDIGLFVYPYIYFILVILYLSSQKCKENNNEANC